MLAVDELASLRRTAANVRNVRVRNKPHSGGPRSQSHGAFFGSKPSLRSSLQSFIAITLLPTVISVVFVGPPYKQDQCSEK